MFKKILSSEKAQTLLEVTIAGALIVIVIAAVSTASIMGLRNSQYAQNQSGATKLAEEGLEKIRSIRNRDNIVCLSASNRYRWSGLYPPGVGLPKTEVNLNNPSCPGIPAGQDWLYATSSTPDLAPSATSLFTRRLFLEKINTTQIKVTSDVSWTDASGPHNSQLVTILSNQ